MNYDQVTTCVLTGAIISTQDQDQSSFTKPDDLESQLAEYKHWLQSQSFSPHTIRAYSVRAKQFILFLRSKQVQQPSDHSSLTESAQAFQTSLLNHPECSPSTVNALLSAVEHFLQFLNVPNIKLSRKPISNPAPNSLDADKESRFLHTVARVASAKESALTHLILSTGIRIAECAALNVSDLEFGPQGNWLSVNSGNSRRIPLNSDTATVLHDWLRLKASEKSLSPALFTNRQGKRISTRGIDYIVRKLGYVARLQVSAEVLRQTCLLKLFNSSHDLNEVAAITGFKALRNAQRYCITLSNTSPAERLL